MLVRYKKALEKIAMGLISLMPQEKEIKRLMETIQHYEQDENWVLYLWKKDDEYVGTVGLVEQDAIATIQHITVIPSYRGEGVAMEMLQELRELGYETIRANEETEPFIQKCIPILKEAD
ncbi:GNAT family N-acetyltransferase [Solibacillus sp. R5-41]|uniref:GNAT family N-acetyltransferase n=1 Tax=Solibacillus sp. R5-41 TaxID=2048654 RepID=UPI000C127ECA|nr:GNAT family N-acetyltransferase [Solibacillus sp. R5-41]ATP39585.1 GNAT family N-acetyltransferase [Solibacillus sp. R5-41]